MIWIRLGQLSGAALGLILLWWGTHKRNLWVRDRIIERYGHDVVVDAAPFLRRDGQADWSDAEGDEFDIGDRVVHDNWIDGTEPRA